MVWNELLTRWDYAAPSLSTIYETYTYNKSTTDSITTLVSEKKNQVNGAVTQTLQYAYHPSGNIASVTDTKTNTSVSYTYDKQGQLTSATHKTGSETWTENYTYDTYGNIRSFDNGTTTHTYTYGDANWKDLLTAVDGHTITYDGSGNPLS